MKVPPKNIDGFVKKPPATALAILVYGPDEGLTRERTNILTATAVADIHDPFAVTDLSAAQFEENPALLADETFSISMLGGRRVVRVRDASDKITALVKGLLPRLKAGDNLILLTADNLPPRSTLRELFEKADNAAAVPCYVEDARDIGRVIADSLRAAGYSIPSEALAYMAGNVIGDRAVARSEVEKLIAYMGAAGKTISLDDVIACVGSSAALSLDGLAKCVASGQFAEAERILSHVLSEGVPAVAVLRNLQNYFLRLHLTKARLQQGEDLESATKKLKPPLFFKVREAFEFQVMRWEMAQLERALNLLAGTEAKCKQTGQEPETLCSRTILSLSQLGAKVTGARRRA